MLLPQEYGEKIEHTIGPSDMLRQAIEDAKARISRPIYDQPNVIDVQAVDITDKLLPGSNDKQSQDRAAELAELLDLDEKPEAGGVPRGTPKPKDLSPIQGSPPENDE